MGSCLILKKRNLDIQALLQGEMSRVLTVLQEGLGSPDP
ncbi:hypothetical protein MC7420_3538 [Coleofasciculus chthonoplastes PCC 7420]|uniref:Uncharacterized protein n=1 Tax=Coleofasciculus chthonoplastes PCC 7420 TaxID=118168 RepID=B4VZY8_9CYAN|nr:hypothetical protein MC7420_3538 [Coleofasciculus chthonoplastes PCC 7420]